MLPFAILFSVAYMVATIMSNGELLGALSMGFSIYRLFRLWLLLGILFSIAAFFLSDLTPINNQRRSHINHNTALTRQSGLTIRTANGFFHSASHNVNQNSFSNVIIIEIEAGQITRRLDALVARYLGEGEERALQLSDVRIITDNEASFFSEYTYEEIFENPIIEHLNVNTSFLTLRQLREHSNFLRINGLSYRSALFTYYSRLAKPLETLLITLMIFVISKRIVKNSLFYTITTCFISAIVLYVLVMMSNYWAQNTFNLILVAYLPYLIFCAIILLYMSDSQSYLKQFLFKLNSRR